jgi:hypothetical protein
MLKPYFHMMKSWSAIVPNRLITNHQLWPLERYLNQVEEILDSLSMSGSEALMPSQSFSVSAAILSAGTAFDRHLPKSWEDMLTLLHQNCLYWIAALNEDLLSSEMMEQSMLPNALKQAIRCLEEKNRAGFTPQRIGIEFRDNEIVLHYNIPLNNHSGSIDLIYEIASSKLKLQGYFLGEARRRWLDTAGWIEILQNAGIFPASRPLSLGPQEIIFFWDLSSETVPFAFEEYRAMARYGMGRQSYRETMEALFDRWQNREGIDLLNQECLREPNPAFHRFYERVAKTPEGCESMLNSARKASKSTKFDIRRGSLELYRQLVDRGQVYEEAILAAKDAFKSRDVGLMLSAIELLEQLVDQGQIHEISAAVKAASSTDDSIRLSALQTLMENIR